MNKKAVLSIGIGIGAALIILLLVGVYYYVSYKSDANAIADIVNEGNNRMEAGEYLDAISCYEKALETEVGDERLTSAIVNAYMLLALNYGENEEAINCYLKAISYNPNNKTAYWAIANIYEGRGDEDTMLNVLKAGYVDTGDEMMNDKVTGIEEERARILAEEEERAREEAERLALEQERAAMLEPLVEIFAAKDFDSIKETLRAEEYVSFSDEVIGDTSYYLGDYSDDGSREGVGIAVYENGYYYYGEFHDNVRSGQGFIMRAAYADSSSIGSFIYDGEWADDKPNGAGKAISNYYRDRISASDFVTKEIAGNYSDGLEDGEMTLTGKTKSGAQRVFKYKTREGVAEKSSNEDSGVKDQYIIAQTSDKSENLTSDGSIRGVEGFVEE